MAMSVAVVARSVELLVLLLSQFVRVESVGGRECLSPGDVEPGHLMLCN